MAVLLPGCSLVHDQTSPSHVSVRGVPATLEQLNTASSEPARERFVASLVVIAGLPGPPPPRSDDWGLVADAGVYEIGRQCDQYLDTLSHFNRAQRAGRDGLAAVAATTGAVMGLAGVGAKAIAITAAAFGLTSSLFDVGVNSVLFTVEPSALRNVMLQGRQRYLDALAKRRISSRPAMLIALQGYLTQCSPAAIEANINNAASSSPYAVTSLDRGQAEQAAALAAPELALLDRARETVSQPLTPTSPTPLSSVIRGAGPIERNIRPSQLERAQAALGVAATGWFDPATRQAIREFQRGWNRRAPTLWPAGEVTGQIAGRTLLVTTLSPMPRDQFSSAFERGFLGEDGGSGPHLARIDSERLDGLLVLLGIPENQAQGMAARLTLARERLRAMHADGTLPPSPTPDALLAADYQVLRPARP